MKILKIFGIVALVHLVAGLILIANPGCRSTKRRSHNAPLPPPVASENTVTYPGAAMSSPTTFGSQDVAPSVNTTELNPGVAPAEPTVSFDAAAAAAPTVRYNPTRPKTAVATALQTAPVNDVTPASTYTVAKGDSLWTIAKKAGLNVNELAAANDIKPNTPVKVGQKLLIPGKASQATTALSTPTPAGVTDTLKYKVKPGETLSQIARKSGTTPAVIKSLNKLTSETLKAGQELVLPAGTTTAVAIATAPEPDPTKSAKSPSSKTTAPYTVHPGETLGQIARKYGVTQRELATLNHITDPLKLRAGQTIQIPSSQPSTPAPAAQIPEIAPSPISPVASPVESSPITPVSPVEAPINRVEESPVGAPTN